MDRIGLLGQRPALVIEVAAVAARVGVSVEPVTGTPTVPVGVAALLVDVGDDGSVWPVPEDPAPAGAGGGGPGVGGPAVIAVCLGGEAPGATGRARSLGASHVVELPIGAAWLADHLGGPPGGCVLGVVGALGGVGATTLAVAAAAAGAREGPCLLVDADPRSPGLDLPLGIPDGSGARWAGIPVTDEPLHADSLRAALPSAFGIDVVTGPLPAEGRQARVRSVLSAARDVFPRTVVDLGRGDLGAWALPDAVACVVPATLAGVVAAQRLSSGPLSGGRVGLVVRPTGWLPVEEVADRLGLPLVGTLPRWRRAAEMADCGELLVGRSGRALRRFGDRTWEVLG